MSYAGGPRRVGYCTWQTTCSMTTIPTESQSTYQAFFGAPSNSFPSPVLATSNTVTPPPWTISLTQSVGPQVTLTATTNYNMSSGVAAVQIWDSSGGGYLRLCSQGTTCSTATTPQRSNTAYVAFVAPGGSNNYPTPNAYATSNSTVPPPWTVSVSVSGSNVTATTNYQVGNYMYVEIFDLTDNGYWFNYNSYCSSGTVCTKTTSYPSHIFIATVAYSSLTSQFPQTNPLATSNQAGGEGPTAPYETAGGSNPAEMNDCYACVGDPINTSTGEYFESVADARVAGRGPSLAQNRTYSSQRASHNSPVGFGWASLHNMKAIVLPDGSVQIEQENGSRVTFAPTGSGAYTAPARVLATLVHNPAGTWTYTRKSKEIFTFSPAGSLTTVGDPNGNTLTLGYDASGNLGTITDGAGRSLSYTYDASGKITNVTDPAGRVTTYGHDTAGRLTSVTAPGGAVTSYTYDAGNLLTSMTDPRGNSMVNTYDAARRVTKQTTAAGNLILGYGYDGTNSVTTITSPGGRVTKETYRAGQMIKRIVGAGTAQAATWTYAYDQSTFARASVTDPLGRVSSATYDSQGNKLTATEPGGAQSSATYGAFNTMLTSTNAAGTTTTFTYDGAGNPLTSSTPLAGTTQAAVLTNTYGNPAHPGDVTAVIDPNGNATTFTYDTYGNRTSVTDALGRATAAAYDILGRKTSSTTPTGKTTSYAYNAAGLLATVTDPLGKVSTYAYDAAGHKTTATDRLGHATIYAYDALGRLTSTTAPDSSTTSSGYDNDGNLTSQTDQSAHVTSYAYDSRNRLTSSTDALNRTTTYAYDAAGQLTGKTDPSGRTTTLSYNTAGDKTGTGYSDGLTPNESFTYTASHQMATITDGTGTTTMSYDSLGRLTSRTNGAGKNITYAYDLAGNSTAQTYPNGQTVTRTYDTANNLTALTDWLNNTTIFTTTADSQPAATTYANGVTATSTYDNAGLPTSITASTASTTLASFTYTRNDNGNLTSANTMGITQPVESYGYTNRDQLASVNTSTYGYDTTGNPTALANGATLAYDAANQPTQYTLGGTTTAITSDNQGNRLTGPAPTIGMSTYTWDQANRLKTANGTTFTYDAAGLRASRTPASGPAQNFTWDTTRAVPLMLSDGALSYIYDASGNPVEHIDASGAAQYYHRDQYGSTRLLTDSAANVSATYTFDSYGKLTAKTGTADTPLRWNGQTQDGDTGLYYLRARYYDPTTAQFLSVDPLASLTRDVYTYANHNPLNRSDPLGLIASPVDVFDGSGTGNGDCYPAQTPQAQTSTATDYMCSRYGSGCNAPPVSDCYSFNACGQAEPGPNLVQQCAGDKMLWGTLFGTGSATGQAVYAKEPSSKIQLRARGGLMFGLLVGVGNAFVDCIPWRH